MWKQPKAKAKEGKKKKLQLNHPNVRATSL